MSLIVITLLSLFGAAITASYEKRFGNKVRRTFTVSFLAFFSILLMITKLFSCNEISKERYKYRIEGKVKVKLKGQRDSSFRPAVWYTDTFFYDRGNVFYYNSDSSKVYIDTPTIFIRE